MYIPKLKNTRLRHILKIFCLNDKGKLLLLYLVSNFLFKVKSLSRVRFFATPWAVAHQTVHGIFQAKILEWVAISFSRRSS